MGQWGHADAEYLQIPHLEATFPGAADLEEAHFLGRKGDIELGFPVRTILIDQDIGGFGADEVQGIPVVDIKFVPAQGAFVRSENTAPQKEALQDEYGPHVHDQFGTVSVGVNPPSRGVVFIGQLVEDLIGTGRCSAHRGFGRTAQLLDPRQYVLFRIRLQRQQAAVYLLERVEDNTVLFPGQPGTADRDLLDGRSATGKDESRQQDEEDGNCRHGPSSVQIRCIKGKRSQPHTSIGNRQKPMNGLSL